MSFTHLHVHTAYSTYDSTGKIPEIINRAKKLGQKSIAITDHGNIDGVKEFFIISIMNGIKPIIGCEIYMTNGSMFEKNISEKRYHLVLLCENDIGYKNLIKIVSLGQKEGLYYKPRIDCSTLSKYHKGLICLTGCLNGEVPQNLLKDDYCEAKNVAKKLIKIFGKNNFCIEIQNHNEKNELKIHKNLIKLSKELSVPLIATNDVHYTIKKDSLAQDCLISLYMGQTLEAKNRVKYKDKKYYLTSEEEMKKIFAFYPKAVSNTKLIADRCETHLYLKKEQYIDLISKLPANMKKYVKAKDSLEINENNIKTFNTYKTIDAIDGIGELFNIKKSKIESLKEKITDSNTLKDLMKAKTSNLKSLDKKKVLDFRNLYKADNDIKKLVDVALKIEGIPIA